MMDIGKYRNRIGQYRNSNSSTYRSLGFAHIYDLKKSQK